MYFYRYALEKKAKGESDINPRFSNDIENPADKIDGKLDEGDDELDDEMTDDEYVDEVNKDEDDD